MAKIPIDERSGGQEFQFRVGSELFGGEGWRGINTEASPGNLPPNVLRAGTNIRLRGGDIFTRPSLSEVVDLRPYMPFLIDPHPQDGEQLAAITWMHEEPGGNPRFRLWMSALKCQGVGGGVGGTIFRLDLTEAPPLQVYASFPAGVDRTVREFTYAGDMFVGNKSQLLQIILQPGIPGLNSQFTIPAPTTLPTYYFDGYEIAWGQEFDGLLHLGLTHLTSPTTLSKIVSWNGFGPTDELTGIRATLAASVLADRLIVGCDATDAFVRIRAVGDAPGTWSTAALGGFFTDPACGNAMLEVRDKMFISSGGQQIFQLEGTTLTNPYTAPVGSSIRGLTLHDGLMHFGVYASGPQESSLARHDPDSNVDPAHEWTIFKNLTDDQPTFEEVRTIASYRQRIVCGSSIGMLVATPVGNPGGTIDVLNAASANGIIGPITQMLRF